MAAGAAGNRPRPQFVHEIGVVHQRAGDLQALEAGPEHFFHLGEEPVHGGVYLPELQLPHAVSLRGEFVRPGLHALLERAPLHEAPERAAPFPAARVRRKRQQGIEAVQHCLPERFFRLSKRQRPLPPAPDPVRKAVILQHIDVFIAN